LIEQLQSSAKQPHSSLPFRENSDSVKPKILFVNRSYWPDAEATGQLLTDLCEGLSEHFDVTVLCGQPNSNPSNADFVASGIQNRHGVTIQRLNHTKFPKSRGAGRMANLISFTLAARRWLKQHAGFDAIVSETDPFLLPLVVQPAAARGNAAYVAYLQDIYPDIAIRLGKAKDGWFTRGIRRGLKAAYSRADRIVVLCESMKSELMRWGLPSTSFEVVPNWVDCEQLVPVKHENFFRQRNGWNDAFVVMHSGNMGLSQKLESLVMAVDQPSFPAHAKLVLIGGGADEAALRDLAAEIKRSDDIEFYPYQDRADLSTTLSAADVQVVSVDPRIGGTLMPSKLYGILASGTPVLGIASTTSDLAKEIVSERIGMVARSHEPADIADAVSAMATWSDNERFATQHRARALAQSTYDKSICIDRFKNILGSAIAARRGTV